MRGMRHGYGVRTSARFGMASHSKPSKSELRNSLSSLGSDDAHNVKTGAAGAAGSVSDEPVIGSEGRDKKLDDTRGGFVLKANSDEQPSRRKTLVSKSTHSLKRTFMSVSIVHLIAYLRVYHVQSIRLSLSPKRFRNFRFHRNKKLLKNLTSVVSIISILFNFSS